MSRRWSTLVDRALEASVVGSFTKIGSTLRAQGEEWAEPEHLVGRRVVITGATSGIGLAAALRMARLGAHVHLVGRNPQKLRNAEHQVAAVSEGDVHSHLCDLSRCHDTRALAAELRLSDFRIDVLVHNAGALLSDFTLTSEGVETTVATHLLNPYLLTEALLASGTLASTGRVITMSSGGMYTQRANVDALEMTATGYSGSVAYARAKRAQTLLSQYWTRRYGSTGRGFHVVHPGWVNTPGVDDGLPLFSKVMGPLLRSPDQGADTLVWLAGQADGEPASGQFWHDRHPRSLYRVANTRLSPDQEVECGNAIATWCDRKIAAVFAAE